MRKTARPTDEQLIRTVNFIKLLQEWREESWPVLEKLFEAIKTQWPELRLAFIVFVLHPAWDESPRKFLEQEWLWPGVQELASPEFQRWALMLVGRDRSKAKVLEARLLSDDEEETLFRLCMESEEVCYDSVSDEFKAFLDNIPKSPQLGR